MGGMWRYFLDVLGWGPIQTPGPLQALTRGAARSMDQTREDMLYLRDQWFPARCEESMVPEHGESRGIIRHVGRHVTETPEQYRARVVHAYAWHMLGGKAQGLPQILRFYGFDVEAIENMRQFSPTRWAEFMVRLRTPDTYADQEAQLTSLKTLIWLVNEYKPARSYFFRLYNDSYDRRPITLGVGPKLGSGWLSFWSGVVVPETGDDGTLVSFGMKYGFQGETLLRQDMQCGLLSLHSSQGMRRRNAFVLGHSRLCGPETLVCATARGTKSSAWAWFTEGEALSERASRGCNFPLGMEKGVVLGDVATAPKAQKFYEEGEFRDLFARHFGTVETGLMDGMVTARCRKPLLFQPRDLAASLRFEFNLPYPDGKRMGLVKQALDVFSVRLGLSLEDV